MSFLKLGLTGIATLLALQSGRLQAQETQKTQEKSLQVREKHVIPSAVQVKITNRGMQYFESNLRYLLGNLGLSFDSGYFPAIQFQADKPINLNQTDLPQDTKQLVTQIQSLLNQWFVGFPLSDIRPAVQIGDSSYTAVFNRFALVGDEALLKSLGKKEGAVLAIELEIQELNSKVSGIRAYDLGDYSQFGQIGFDNLTAQVGGGKNPLKIRLPFYVKTDSKGVLQFEALKIQENLNQVDVELKYEKFISPKVVLEINGIRKEMNTKRLENELATNLPQMIRGLRSYIADFANKQLPELLNNKAKQALVGALEEINRLEPPGAENGEDVVPLLWGLQLQNIFQNNGLGIQLKAYVEDPLNPKSQLSQNSGSRAQPKLNALSADDYDIAMTLDRALINRILQLSFNRGLFSNLKVGTPGALKLTDAPTIDYIATPTYEKNKIGEAFIKIYVKARAPKGMVTGVDTWGLKDGFEFSMNLIAKMRKAKKSKTGVEIQLHSIEAGSLWINPSDQNWASAFVNVEAKVWEKLLPIVQSWQTNEQLLPGNLPLPPEVLGLKLNINHLTFDPGGHLVLYLNYAPLPSVKITSPEIHLANDKTQLNGRYVTVYYVNGRRSSLATASDQLVIHEVRSKVTLKIEPGSKIIPAQTITKYGIRSAFNMLIFVLHKSPEAPALENIDLNARSYRVKSMTTSEYNQYLSEKVDFIGISLSDLFQ